MSLTVHGQLWLKDPHGGGTFTDQRDAVLAHDPACISLSSIWTPRKGSASSPSDLMECEVCKITFLWSGLREAFRDCQFSFHYYCACCLKKVRCCPCGDDEAYI